MREQRSANRSAPQGGDISTTLANVAENLNHSAVLGNMFVIAGWRCLAWTEHRATPQQLDIFRNYLVLTIFEVLGFSACRMAPCCWSIPLEPFLVFSGAYWDAG